MISDPTQLSTIGVDQLPSAPFNLSDELPHAIGSDLKRGTVQSLADFISGYLGASSGVGFRAVSVNDGDTLPATTQQEFILVGPGTYYNVGGGATIATTEELNALVSNGSYWFIGVEIPISAELAGITQFIRSGFTTTAPSEDAVAQALSAFVSKSYVDNGDAQTLVNAKAYTDSAVTGLWDDRGNFTPTTSYPSTGGSGTGGAILKGDIWTISGLGAGNSATLPVGQVVYDGDTVRALIDSPGNTQANWAIQQTNIGYVPENSANKSTSTADSASSVKFPVWSAIVSYFSTSKIKTILGQASASVDGWLSSTDWNTFNNKQNALTNPITGTGTTDTIPKFSSSTGLADSNIISKSSGNVLIGISTDNTVDKLQVNGSMLATTVKSTNDAIVNGVRVGIGGGGINSNLVLNSNLLANTTGGQNIAIGILSLNANTSGNNNVAVGIGALQNINTGSNTVALGVNAGKWLSNGTTSLTSSNQSIYIGSSALAGVDGVTNENVIGYNAIGNGSNSMTLGNAAITKTILRGNTLIGTTTDNGVDKLQVNGTISASAATTSNQVVIKSQLDANDGNAMHLTGDETWTGTKTSSPSTAAAFVINNSRANISSGHGIDMTNTNTGNAINVANSSTGRAIRIVNSNTGIGYYAQNTSTGQGISVNNASSGIGAQIVNTSTGNAIQIDNSVTNGLGLVVNNASSASGKPFQYNKNGVEKVSIDDSGNLSAQSILKSGAASTDALMGNGAVTVLTSGNYSPSITNGSGISATGGTGTYTRVGDIVTVTVYITALTPLSSNSNCSVIISLPVNRTVSTLKNAGSGSLVDGTLTNFQTCFLQIDASNSATLYLRSSSTGGGTNLIGNITFQYNING